MLTRGRVIAAHSASLSSQTFAKPDRIDLSPSIDWATL